MIITNRTKIANHMNNSVPINNLHYGVSLVSDSPILKLIITQLFCTAITADISYAKDIFQVVTARKLSEKY